jgi:uncharacterized protein YndB with AHSA1/START domain
MTHNGDYENQVHLNASPERVFEIMTTAAEFGAWWAPATGSAAEGGELRITFDGIDDPLLLRVRQATRPSAVTWEVTACAFLLDWVGTTLVITLRQDGSGGCDLRFRHEGLTPQLECYEMCRAGWEQYLPSLRDYVETGTGNPYTLARLG